MDFGRQGIPRKCLSPPRKPIAIANQIMWPNIRVVRMRIGMRNVSLHAYILEEKGEVFHEC
jgi:hypothetical protein